VSGLTDSAGRTPAVERRPDVRAAFEVDGDAVAARGGEVVYVALRLGNHQVRVEKQACAFPQRADDHLPE